MSQDYEGMLRNALDAVDRGRRWAMLGIAALFAATLLLLFILAHASAPIWAGGISVDGATTQTPAPGMSKALFLTLAVQFLFGACCTAVVMLHVTRTAKAILRAIELRRKE